LENDYLPWMKLVTDKKLISLDSILLMVKSIFLDNEREARDAKIKLDGFEIELPSNTATELIPGVTLDLKKNYKW
jgi:flagellar capping protein FliD